MPKRENSKPRQTRGDAVMGSPCPRFCGGEDDPSPDRFATAEGRLKRGISHRHEHPSRVGPEDFPEQLGNFADDGGTASRLGLQLRDRKSTRLNSSHAHISYAVFCLKKNNTLSALLLAAVYFLAS